MKKFNQELSKQELTIVDGVKTAVKYLLILKLCMTSHKSVFKANKFAD